MNFERILGTSFFTEHLRKTPSENKYFSKYTEFQAHYIKERYEVHPVEKKNIKMNRIDGNNKTEPLKA